MYRLYIDLGVQKTSIMWEQFLILTGVMHLSNPASSAGPDKNEKKKKKWMSDITNHPLEKFRAPNK